MTPTRFAINSKLLPVRPITLQSYVARATRYEYDRKALPVASVCSVNGPLGQLTVVVAVFSDAWSATASCWKLEENDSQCGKKRTTFLYKEGVPAMPDCE